MREEEMSAKVAFDEYKKNKIITASGVELIIQFYDEIIKNIQLAREVLSKGDKLSFDEIKSKGKTISKAMNIVTGLADSLDMEKGGEIAVNLGKLYEFVNMRLLNANVNNDPVMLDDALRILHELREAWVGILKQGSEDKRKEVGDSDNREKLREQLQAKAVDEVKGPGTYNRLVIKT
jgi:flagellar protein FliS